MGLNIDTKVTDWGLYLTAHYKGCKYGQGYNNGETMEEAKARFYDYVRHLSKGHYWKVTR